MATETLERRGNEGGSTCLISTVLHTEHVTSVLPNTRHYETKSKPMKTSSIRLGFRNKFTKL